MSFCDRSVSSKDTLRMAGKITKGGHYRYPKKDILTTQKDTIKSTREQSNDLERQFFKVDSLSHLNDRE